MTNTGRPNQSDRKADWVDYVRSLDPHGNQGDPEALTKEDLIELAGELENQQPDSTEGADTGDSGQGDRVGEGGVVDRDRPADAVNPAGSPAAGETRTAQNVGTGDAAQSPDLGGYHTETAAPPARTSAQRSATASAVTDRAPEDAARMADQQTPPPSERIMGLPDSPRAAETGQGH